MIVIGDTENPTRRQLVGSGCRLVRDASILPVIPTLGVHQREEADRQL
jgi:hypothetical protein